MHREEEEVLVGRTSKERSGAEQGRNVAITPLSLGSLGTEPTRRRRRRSKTRKNDAKFAADELKANRVFLRFDPEDSKVKKT